MSYENKIKVTYRILDITKTLISIPPELQDTTPTNVDRITDKQLPWVAFIFPPVLITLDAKTFELVDRRWCYQMQIERKIDHILFLVFEDRSDIDHYNDKIRPPLTPLIDGFVTSMSKMTSKATLARHKAITSKRVCPFCHEALMRPRGIWQADKNGFFRAHCFNTKQGRCDFYLLLTTPEKQNFESYKFASNDYVKEIEGKMCPKCGQQLYLRTLHLDNGTTLQFNICRNYRMSIKHSCDYKFKVKGDSK